MSRETLHIQIPPLPHKPWVLATNGGHVFRLDIGENDAFAIPDFGDQLPEASTMLLPPGQWTPRSSKPQQQEGGAIRHK